jgi:membrane-anchored protein YejM (alkaline phosphatase superfamily)
MGTFIPRKDAAVALSHINSFRPAQPEKGELQLQYPLSPLSFTAPNPRQNILVIVIDSWRFDMLNDEVMPNLSRFGSESWTFTKHFSGGNATGPGIFSLLYGIPATYWTAMENQHRGPVLIDALLKENYQVKVIASAGLTTPAFNRTVFQSIPDIKETETQAGKTPHERDKIVTQKFNEFMAAQSTSSAPFFAFLLYDSAHSFCSDNENTHPFQPIPKECVRFSFSSQRDSIPYFNLYKNALHFVDQEIASVLQTLNEKHLLENTVVLITGDHGEEFDDNHMGYFGHAGNFTHYQVQTPLVMHVPHAAPHLYTHQTSHFDVVPTLMKDLLSVQNSPDDYSVGTHLLDESERSYLVVSSYVDFGIVEPAQITTIFPTGYFLIEQQDGQNLANSSLNIPVLDKVFKQMRQFYKA